MYLARVPDRLTDSLTNNVTLTHAVYRGLINTIVQNNSAYKKLSHTFSNIVTGLVHWEVGSIDSN